MWNNVKAWWSNPYQENMSAGKWFLMVGLILIAGMIWTATLRRFAD